MDEIQHRCKDCDNFIGGGDFDLCCKNPPEEDVAIFGHLCYEDTPACRNFISKKENKL